MLLRSLIRELDERTEYSLNKYAKLGAVADTPENLAAIQNFDKLERWADRNLRLLNKEKCKVLHLGLSMPSYQYKLKSIQLESSFAENDEGVLVDIKMSRTQQCALIPQKLTVPWVVSDKALPAGESC